MNIVMFSCVVMCCSSRCRFIMLVGLRLLVGLFRISSCGWLSSVSVMFRCWCMFSEYMCMWWCWFCISFIIFSILLMCLVGMLSRWWVIFRFLWLDRCGYSVGFLISELILCNGLCDCMDSGCLNSWILFVFGCSSVSNRWIVVVLFVLLGLRKLYMLLFGMVRFSVCMLWLVLKWWVSVCVFIVSMVCVFWEV